MIGMTKSNAKHWLLGILLIYAGSAVGMGEVPATHDEDDSATQNEVDSEATVQGSIGLCDLHLDAAQSYKGRGDHADRLLSLWRVSKICRESTEPYTIGSTRVRAELRSRNWLLADGPLAKPLERVVWYLTSAYSIPEDSLASAAVVDEKVLFFLYHKLSCRTGILTASLLPQSAEQAALPFGSPLRDKNPFSEPVRLPRLRVAAEKFCGRDSLNAHTVGDGVLLTLSQNNSGRGLVQFLFTPEKPLGCGKWYRVIGEQKVRIRYDRPLGAPVEEFEYIREMETKCDDF